MRATVQAEYGSADVLQTHEIARPAIGDDELLVRVHAAGLDRGTWHLMAGKPYLMRLMGYGLRAPKNRVAGRDIAGTVARAGARVTKFEVGDEVFGISEGSFAEYACVRADRLALKPADLAFEKAATLAISGITALQGLRDLGRVQPGQHVLIVGASGGVGTFAVQLAKALGAEVTGVCSTAKVDFVRSIGADHVIDYTRGDFADGAQRYDVILDIGGNTSLSRLRRALTQSGTLVFVGGENSGRWTGMGRQLRGIMLSLFVRQRLTMKTPKENGADLERLAELVEAGELTPIIDRTFTLDEAPDAMRYLLAGRARGKLAITVRPVEG